MKKFYVYYTVYNRNEVRNSHSTIHADTESEAMDLFEEKHPNCSVDLVTPAK